jgi:hypothetical protein
MLMSVFASFSTQPTKTIASLVESLPRVRLGHEKAFAIRINNDGIRSGVYAQAHVQRQPKAFPIPPSR